MRRTYLLIQVLGLLWLLPSCRDETDLNGESRPRELTVEGRIAFGEPAEILLQTGGDLSNPDLFHPITSARVRLSDNEGLSEILAHQEAGRYRSSALVGQLGRQYALEIALERHTVTGLATMPRQVVVIDSAVHRHFRDEFNFLHSAIDVYLSVPPDQAVYGWTELTVKGRARKERFFLERSRGGEPVLKQEFLVFPFLVRGQTVIVEFTQVDEAVFRLFRDLSSRSAQTYDLFRLTAAPGILSANLNGQTPGYFAAVTVDRDTVVVE